MNIQRILDLSKNALLVIITIFSMCFAPSLLAANSAIASNSSNIDRNCDDNWPSYGKTLDNHRNACGENRINKNNVNDLKVKWIFSDPNSGQAMSGSPTIVDDVMYIANGPGTTNGFAYALNAQTGSIKWQRALQNATYYVPTLVGKNVVYVKNDAGTIYALDKNDGHIVAQTNVLPNPAGTFQGILGGLVLVEEEDLLFAVLSAGTSNQFTQAGAVVALRASTLQEVWRYKTSLNPSGPNSGGTGVGIFGTPAIDRELGILYIGTGQNTTEPVTPIADALIALNYRSGNQTTPPTLVWFRQYTNDDVGICLNFPTCSSYGFTKDWDADGGPYLVTVKNDGNSTKELVIIGTKQGMLYAHDAADGDLAWSTLLTPPPPIGYLLSASPIPQPSLLLTFAVPASSNGGVNGFGCSDGENIYIASSYSVTGAPIRSSTGLNTANNQPVAGTDIVSVRASDGKILWRKPVTGMSVTAMSVANGVVYSTMSFGTRDNSPLDVLGGVLRAQDAKTGEVLFEYIYNSFEGAALRANTVNGSPTIYKGNVYVPFGARVTVGGVPTGTANILVFGH